MPRKCENCGKSRRAAAMTIRPVPEPRSTNVNGFFAASECVSALLCSWRLHVHGSEGGGRQDESLSDDDDDEEDEDENEEEPGDEDEEVGQKLLPSCGTVLPFSVSNNGAMDRRMSDTNENDIPLYTSDRSRLAACDTEAIAETSELGKSWKTSSHTCSASFDGKHIVVRMKTNAFQL